MHFHQKKTITFIRKTGYGTHVLFMFWVGLGILTPFRIQAQPSSYNVSYFGQTITHPGLKAGFEFSIHSNQLTKTRRNGRKIAKQNEWFYTTNAGFFYQRRFNTSVLVNSEIGYRRVRKRGFKMEVLLGAGVMRTFVNADTYRVNDVGEVDRVRLAGQWGFVSSLSLGLGKDLGFVKESTWAFQVKPTVYFQMPYNQTVLPHVVLEAGITRKFHATNHGRH